jgi:hypothetical protein
MNMHLTLLNILPNFSKNTFSTGAENPTYLKESGDKVLVAIGFLGLAVGLGNIFKGLYNMSYGINKVA